MLQLDLADERVYYEMSRDERARQVGDSEFWDGLQSQLREADDRHLVESRSRKLRLLADRNKDSSIFQKKEWSSFVLKTYRKNVLDNANWPAAPETGWIVPGNWLDLITDVVRTGIVTKYLDGVSIVAELIMKAVDDAGAGVTGVCEYEARMEGYYAVHAVICIPIRLPDKGWRYETKSVPVEFQVFTQMQDVIRNLTHPLYDYRRRRPAEKNTRAFWDYRGDQFVPNYLGHVLHYLDGAIMNVRERG